MTHSGDICPAKQTTFSEGKRRMFLEMDSILVITVKEDRHCMIDMGDDLSWKPNQMGSFA